MDDDARRDIDPTTISLSGAYNYTTGGDDNALTDREIVHAYEKKWPGLVAAAVANAHFGRRVVEYFAEQGIRQILEVGAGRPKPEPGSNVHEILQARSPDARVVYVERDPTAHSHARAMWGSGARTAYVEADLRDVDQVLASPDLRRLIDFDEPVGVLMLAVLHFVTDDAAEVAAAYAERVPSGSLLAVSHVGADGAAPGLVADLEALYAPAGGMRFRTGEEIAELFAGWPLVEPGLVDIRDWRPTEHVDHGPLPFLGGVARKP